VTVAVLTRDIASIPTAYLTLAKTHMRVNTADDDAFIKSCIARAIARFEETNEVTVNTTTVKWTPALTDFTDNVATVPVRPVTAIAVAPPAVIASYSVALKWDSIHGVPLQVLIGPAASGLEFTLTCGFVAATPPPAVEDAILRHAGHLYEHREILVPGQFYTSPDLKLDAAWWAPRL
jgi:hypothetical protein